VARVIYFPQQHLKERIRERVKRAVFRPLVESKNEAKNLVLGARCQIRKLPQMMKMKLFFHQPVCKYAAT